MSEEDITASKFLRLLELRTKRDEKKTAAEESERSYRAYESELFDELEESPMQGRRRIDLGEHGVVSFTPRETFYGRIIDKDAAMNFFEERGQTDLMVTPKISAQRLNELVREHLDMGRDMPPGVDWRPVRGITISRPKT